MQILALELEDVKSYANARIDFRRGVNAIVGANGAGKSTILEAIGFALFDHLGYKQQDFVREGKNTATIAVTFISSHDERQYQTVRKYGSSNQHYIFDPELDKKIVEGKADVLTFLRLHMGVEPGADLARLFADAVGVPQGAFTAAFLLTPAQRKSTFDPLLQVDEYKKAFDGLREPLSLLKARAQELAVEAAGLAARLEQLPELETALKQRAQELGQAEKTLAELAARQAEVVAAREALDAQQQEIRTLQQQKATLQERHAAGQRRLSGAAQMLAEARSAAAILAKRQAGHDAYVAAQAEQLRLEERVRQRQALRDRQSEVDKALALTRNQLERASEEVNAAANAAQTVQRLAPAVEEQKRLEADLQKTREAARQREELGRQISRQEAELKTLRARAETLAAQLEQAQAHEATRAALETSLTADQQALDAARESLGRIQADAESVKEQTTALEAADTAICPVCEQPLTPDHRTEMLARNRQRVETLRETYRKVQQQVKEDEDALQGKRVQLRQVQQALLALPRAEELTTLRTEIDERATALAALQQQLAERADVQHEMQELETRLAELGNPREQSAIAADRARAKADVARRQAELAEQADEQSRQIVALTAELADFADLDAERAANSATLAENQEAYQAVLSHRQMAAGVQRYEQEVKEAQAEQTALDRDLAELAVAAQAAEEAFDVERHAIAVAQEQQVRGEIAALQTRRTMLTEDQARDEATLSRLREIQAQLDEIRQRQRAYARQEEILEALRSVLREAGPYITATLIRQVSEDAARIFSELMQDYTRHLTWAEDYNILLDVNGNERQFSQLSGGEQMSAALAVRLALLREMSSIDIAFFDEPTTNLDEVRREALARQILNVDGLRQLFVISHDDTFEQATQNLIRIQKAGGVSRVGEEG
jgi:exonuclease SbcC